MEIEDRIYTGLKQFQRFVGPRFSVIMEIEDRIYTGLKLIGKFVADFPA